MQIHAPLLGKSVASPTEYAPQILCPIARAPSRVALGEPALAQLPFQGQDSWTCYEFSWLNSKGKPCVGILECTIPAHSTAFIESKSFKLYLQSFAGSQWPSKAAVEQVISQDIQRCTNAPCQVRCIEPPDFAEHIAPLPGLCLDGLDIAIACYQPNAQLLRCEPEQTSEAIVHSNLLKSNCPVTGQPDFGSVIIAYQGPTIEPASLLRYIVSYRHHTGFHEQCVEMMFMDIWQQCQPQALTVIARYTRRGGLDINPLRSSHGAPYPGNTRHYRQ